MKVEVKHLVKSVEESLNSIDLSFNELQTIHIFFIFELFLAIYVLLNLALIAETFMMPSLLAISCKYGLSKDLTGLVVAVGGLVPELTTTALSFFRHGIKMSEFGVASNIGCAIFTITVVPAVALLGVQTYS